MTTCSKQLSADELLRRLSAEEIRDRLAALTEEEKALRVLLRAALRLERGTPTSGKKGGNDQ